MRHIVALCMAALLVAGCVSPTQPGSDDDAPPSTQDTPSRPEAEESSSRPVAPAENRTRPSGTPLDGEPEDCDRLTPRPDHFASPLGLLGGWPMRDAHLLFAVDASFPRVHGPEWRDMAQGLVDGMDAVFTQDLSLRIIPIDIVVMEFDGDSLEDVPRMDGQAALQQAAEISQTIRAEFERRFADVERDAAHVFIGTEVAGLVAGMASCLGGAKYPSVAYTWSEATDDEPFNLAGAARAFREGDLKVAVHEFGHMLGALHDYANCAEAAPTYDTDDAFGTCTLMFNDSGLHQRMFSTANRLTMRAWADHVDL